MSAPRDYGLADRLLGKTYSIVERFTQSRPELSVDRHNPRDIVLIPFGMGIGNTPFSFKEYECNKALVTSIFSQMSDHAGFNMCDYEQEQHYGNLHDGCCWAVADDFYHVLRLLNDLKESGNVAPIDRLQILPHSAGIFIGGWLSGIVSVHDMMQLTHECSQILADGESRAARQEVDSWYFQDDAAIGEKFQSELRQLRKYVDPSSSLDLDSLAPRLHGKLQFLFCPKPGMLEDLIADVIEQKINVHVAIRLSPHCIVLAGNALETERFYQLFTPTRMLAIRRVTLQIKGTSHSIRCEHAAKKTRDLMDRYLSEGRLKDPVIPFTNWKGEWVQSKEGFADTVAGNANQTFQFDKMVQTSYEHGAKHFVLLQSGTAKVAGDVFDGVIRSNVTTPKDVHVYKSVTHDRRHPLIDTLFESNPHHRYPTPIVLNEIVHWYESQVEQRRGKSLPVPLKSSVELSR